MRESAGAEEYVGPGSARGAIAENGGMERQSSGQKLLHFSFLLDTGAQVPRKRKFMFAYITLLY